MRCVVSCTGLGLLKELKFLKVCLKTSTKLIYTINSENANEVLYFASKLK